MYLFAVPNSGFLGIIASLNSSPTGYSNFTKIGSFSTNGSSEVTSVWTGDKTLWQKKVMTTANTPSQMNFNGLGVGKTYRLTVYFHVSVANYRNLYATNGGTIIQINQSTGLIVGTEYSEIASTVFVASETTVVFTQSGDSALTAAHSILEELPNHEQVTDWT